MWMETWESNEGAVNLYEKAGFEFVTQRGDVRIGADDKEVEDVRCFYRIPSLLHAS